MGIKRIVFPTLLFLLVAVFGASSASAQSAPKAGGTLQWANGIGLGNFNPIAPRASSPANQIFASLTRISRDEFEFTPYLAKSWEIAPDGLSYTFHLEDAVFHDGKPVTSEDVAWSVELIQKFHRLKQALAPVTSVDTPDSKTAILRLSKPHAAVMLATASPLFLPILPKHVYSTDEDYINHPAHWSPVGAGPFKYSEHKPDEFQVLLRNENYFRPDQPYMDRLVIRFIKDPQAVIAGLRSETIHLATSASIPFRDLARLQELDHIATAPGQRLSGLFQKLQFNLREAPFNDKRVRQAVAYAVDRKFISEVLFSGIAPVMTAQTTAGGPFHGKNLNQYKRDLDRAAALLDEAGYPMKSDGTRLELTLTNQPILRHLSVPIEEYIVQALAEVGVKVSRDPIPDYGAWAKKIGAFEFQFGLASPAHYTDPIIGMSRFFLCSNILPRAYTNMAGYCNPEVDALFEAGAEETDLAKRQVIYQKVQEILTEDLPYLPIIENASVNIFHSGLGNPPADFIETQSGLDELYWIEEPT